MYIRIKMLSLANVFFSSFFVLNQAGYMIYRNKPTFYFGIMQKLYHNV